MFVSLPVIVTLPAASAAFKTLSRVNGSISNRTLFVFGPTVSTISVAGCDELPAGSFATAVTISPLFKPPGFGTVQLPSGPATTCAVLPSGKVTVTVEPGSAVPVIGSVALIGSISGAFGGVTSTVYTWLSVTVLLLPAASVNFTFASIVLSASANKPLPGTLTLHVPFAVFTVAI